MVNKKINAEQLAAAINTIADDIANYQSGVVSSNEDFATPVSNAFKALAAAVLEAAGE